mmetsp:Transcript_114357/g.243935  ORF Transcript_114357/g.243935 Transcript_114357/m.243935 type:complete len:163 (+) Transcript_114357:81-569(+)
MSANLVVPSDITILEEKHKVGKRKLGWLEMTGLMGMAPMLHIHYSKMDPGDMRKILSKKFDPEDKSPVVDICKRRQAAVSKTVVSHNFLWGGAWTMTGLCWWSFRRYNYQSRLVALPFIFYAGTFVGRVVGDIVTSKNSEYARDTFLGTLPAKIYYAPSAEA